MTSRERVETALLHEPPDRTPMFDYVLYSPVAADILGREFVDYSGDRAGWIERARERGWRNELDAYARDRLDLAEILGYDLLYICPNPVPREFNAESDDASGHSDDFLVGDPVERVSKRNELRRERGFVVEEDSLLVYRLIVGEMDAREIDLPIIAPAYAHGIWTDSDLMQSMVLAPEVAHEHFRLATVLSLSRIESYIEVDVDLFGVGGDFAGSRPLISPEMYRRFIVPEVAKCSDRIHASGKWAVNASDGDLWSVIDDFLIDCRVDGYLEIDMFAGMGLAELKRGFGDRIAFFGNMDCGNVLSFASPEEICRITREIIEAGSGNGGHIFCSSNAITASVPTANYLAMVNAYRTMFGISAVERAR